MPTGIHVLLTYRCTYQCDHCFLHCGPQRAGAFTIPQLRILFDEIGRIGTIQTVYFEGGEPFLHYATLLEGVRMARAAGLETALSPTPTGLRLWKTRYAVCARSAT